MCRSGTARYRRGVERDNWQHTVSPIACVKIATADINFLNLLLLIYSVALKPYKISPISPLGFDLDVLNNRYRHHLSGSEITVATVILRAIDRVRERALGLLGT